MAEKVNGMIGRRFGRYVVVAESEQRTKSGTIKYVCKCDCGNTRTISGSLLRNGESKSCGCYNRDLIKKDNPKYKRKLYFVYRSMLDRCNNPNCKSYNNYGGRGISVSQKWDTYEKFEEWCLNNGYEQGLWLDRIDNNGNYSPDNCRFITPKEQQNNKRTNVNVTIGGITMTIKQWSEKSGIGFATIERRIECGWKEDDLLKPVNKKYSHSEAIKNGLHMKKIKRC